MWKKKKVKPKQLAVNVSEDTRRRIEEEAEAEDISVSAWIGRAIDRYFETKNNKREEKIK
jgi:predicted HicB family RNase H-like nuclease